ncbi:MAG TPA: PH domain-containing protein [Gemmatimonadales bacterium]|nr:PH domain-containing protein [Gemmatimonadales bacterium]
MLATTYSMIPAQGSRTLWVLVPVILLLIGGTLFLLGRTVWGAKHATFELSAEGLAFHGDVWGKAIPLAALRGGAARIVDVNTEPGLRPVSRTMGTALPGYQSGWFRLADGEKALLYLSDRHRALYIPTTLGYSVLLSPSDPDAMLADLRRLAPAT